MNKIEELLSAMGEEEFSEICKTIFKEKKNRRKLQAGKYEDEIGELFTKIINDGYNLDVFYDNVNGCDSIRVHDSEEYY